ncbi:hypothetical protein SCYAM73S_06193 [Streptomyces cyaneofuscatus]
MGVRRIVGDQAFGLGEGAGEQLVGGGGDPDSGGALLVAQGPAETAQVGGVHGAEGGGEEGEGGLGGEPGGGDAGCLLPVLALPLVGPACVQRRRRHRPQGRQQRGDGRFVAEREVVAVDLQGDAGRGEGAPDGGQRAASGPYQHGHLAPRDPVLQVGAAQQVRDVVQLRGGGRVGVRLHPAALPDGVQLAVGADGVGGQPGQRHPAGEQPGRGEQFGAGAAGGGEDADGGGGAVGPPEGVGEFEDAVHVGAPERVDRLVRVAEGHQRAPAPRVRAASPVPGQRVQQAYLGRVGVLVLVDVHRVVRPRQLRRDLRALREQHRAVDQLRVVRARPGRRARPGTRRGTGPPRSSPAGPCGGRRRRARPARGPVHGCGRARRAPRRRSRGWSGRRAARRASGRGPGPPSPGRAGRRAGRGR